ncbi:hypothetical protein OIU85_006311 [Salix viminalis]|uniref:RanBP2-type domain-containing protein n=1 Tax=Salix viminalis TaxID=40686 RepID=A0A9Q0PKW7_SALVM|nr:hypothetical protein OIU85_006311 [Salix viminalis]
MLQGKHGNRMETGFVRIQASHMQIAPYALLFKQLFQCNFAFRGVCNRCASARPSGPFGSGAGAVGHGRGRVANDSGVPGRCGNINWAKRTECNVCNTNKPGHNEGGVRGGRGGGYKEPEEELDETTRRRKEAEKTFRAKTQQAEAGRVHPGAGRAGWEVDEFGLYLFFMNRSSIP